MKTIKLIKDEHQFIASARNNGTDFEISGFGPDDAVKRLMKYIEFDLSCYFVSYIVPIDKYSLDIKVIDRNGRK